MRFHLSSEQEALQDSVQALLSKACPPDRRRALMEAAETDPEDLWQGLMDLGLGGLMVPEDLGGVGLGLEEAALAMEVVGRHGAPTALFSHMIGACAAACAEVELPKNLGLEQLISGERRASLAMAGWDPDAWPTSCDGRITGVFPFTEGAGAADAFVVLLGDGVFLVEPGPGVVAEKLDSADRTRPLWRLALEEAPALRLGPAGLGGRLLDAALVLLAADALGGAQQCLDMSVAYALVREQFGTVIGRFQALKHQLATMALEVETARGLVWYAAHAWDHDLPDRAYVAAHAKAHLADRFTNVARAAVQAHGGIGYTWEHDLQIWFRRSLQDRAWLGAPSLHRRRAASLAGW